MPFNELEMFTDFSIFYKDCLCLIASCSEKDYPDTATRCKHVRLLQFK